MARIAAGIGPTVMRFVAAALLAMGVATALGWLGQRWMTYELLSVDGGGREWALAAGVLVALGLLTAVLVGLPCFVLARLLTRSPGTRAVVACGSAAAVTALLHSILVPFGTTAVDHALIPALALVFFVVLYAASQPRPTPRPPRGETLATG